MPVSQHAQYEDPETEAEWNSAISKCLHMCCVPIVTLCHVFMASLLGMLWAYFLFKSLAFFSHYCEPIFKWYSAISLMLRLALRQGPKFIALTKNYRGLRSI